MEGARQAPSIFSIKDHIIDIHKKTTICQSLWQKLWHSPKKWSCFCAACIHPFLVFMDRMYPSKGRGSSQTVQCSPRGSVVRWSGRRLLDNYPRYGYGQPVSCKMFFREEGIYEVDTTVTKRTYTAEELRKVIIGYTGGNTVGVNNKQDSTQRNYEVLKKVR